MLEELDLLSQKIQKLVSKVTLLSQEASGLRQALAQVTAQRDELKCQLDAEKAQQAELVQSLGSAQSAVEQTRDQAALQGTLDLFRQENESMQSSLKTRNDEVARLREVNEQARQRIDGVLEKLPGAAMPGDN